MRSQRPPMARAGARPWLLAAFLGLFFVVGWAMMNITASVKPKALRLEFPWTKKAADEILDKWKNDPATAGKVRKSLALDFLFIVAYVGGLVVAAAMATGVLGWAPSVGAAITWGVIAAGLLDVCENISQFAMLAGRRGLWPQFTSGCATAKFLLVGIALLYALCGLAVAGIRHFRNQP